LWEYLGGSIPRAQRYVRERDKVSNLKEYLDRQAFLAESEIIDLRRYLEDDEQEIFEKVGEEITRNGYYVLSKKKDDKLNDNKLNKVIEFFSEKEILFFAPPGRKVTGNSRIYEKGMERLIKS